MTEQVKGAPEALRRTAKYETLPLNRGKRRMLLGLVRVYTEIKDSFLRMLGKTSAWHQLDDARALRATTKDTRRDRVPDHLQDQALFDAADTMRRACPNPACGYVHRDNRHGDRFHCLQCGRDGDADVVAAENLLARVHDAEIHRWTPVDRVKGILLERFHCRKETGPGAKGTRAATRGRRAQAKDHLGDDGRGTPLPAGLHKSRRNPVPSGA